MKLILANDLKLRLTGVLGVTLNEIEECFLNRSSSFTRLDFEEFDPEGSVSGGSAFGRSTFEGSDSDNSAYENLAFIAKTDRGRLLRIKFNIKNKLKHVLQLPDRTVTMEQDGIFCEVTAVESTVREKLASES